MKFTTRIFILVQTVVVTTQNVLNLISSILHQDSIKRVMHVVNRNIIIDSDYVVSIVI